MSINELFTEKYRPRKVDDILAQEHIVKDFKGYVKNRDIPNMILSGQAGTGKTSIAKALAEQTVGMGNTFYLDCSRYNGVKDIKRKVIPEMTRYTTKIDFINLFILDEADKLSTDAQQVLRIPIEENSRFCRLIIICNYIRKIIKPLQSRCAYKYVVKKIPDKIILNKLIEIANIEGIKIREDLLEKMVKSKHGDMRACLNILGGLKKGASIESQIEKDYDKEFVSLCVNGKFHQLRDYIDTYIADSDQFRELVRNSIDIIIESDSISKIKGLKPELIKLLGECEYRLIMGSNHYSISFWLCANAFMIKERLMR